MGEEALRIFRQIDDAWGTASTLGTLALADVHVGDYRAAQARWRDALDIYRALGDAPLVSVTLSNLGTTAARLNDWDRTETLYEESLAVRRDTGDGTGRAELILNNLGVAALHLRDAKRAASHSAEALILCRERDDRFRSGTNLEGWAGVAGFSGQPERAARLFGAAESIVETSGGVRQPGSSVERDRWKDAVRAMLGADAYAAAFAEGRTLSHDAAVALALEQATSNEHG